MDNVGKSVDKLKSADSYILRLWVSLPKVKGPGFPSVQRPNLIVYIKRIFRKGSFSGSVIG